MGQVKLMDVGGGRMVKVRTLKLGQVLLLESAGKRQSLGELVMASLDDEDRQYIAGLDYDGEKSEGVMQKLIAGFQEVNPVFFRKPEKELTGSQTSSSGRQASSDTPLNKP